MVNTHGSYCSESKQTTTPPPTPTRPGLPQRHRSFSEAHPNAVSPPKWVNQNHRLTVLDSQSTRLWQHSLEVPVRLSASLHAPWPVQQQQRRRKVLDNPSTPINRLSIHLLCTPSLGPIPSPGTAWRLNRHRRRHLRESAAS